MPAHRRKRGIKMGDITFWIAVSAAAVAALILAVSYICFVMTFKNSSRDRDNPHADVKLKAYAKFKPQTTALINEIAATDFEAVSTVSHDGLKLYGRYYHFVDGAPLEIQIHGYKGHAYRDFCGGARDAMARGHNLLLVDQRAHGKSEGSVISFGIKERYDCHAWINYAISRFGEGVKIFLLGMSMGAATVLMASELPLPGNVVGIMADCPYSSPGEIIRKVIKEDLRLPVSILYPFVRLGGRLYGGFDLEEAAAETAVRNSKIPTLILHGECDSFVPCSMSERIFANCTMPIRRRVTFPEADHGLSYLTDKDYYLSNVDEFMAAALSNGK